MGLKKRLGMGIMAGMLGISLVGGGTFAYFSDTEVSNNTFAAGTLDLSLNPTEIIKVDNIKPGDHFTRTFELYNNGSLDIAKVLLNTEYTVNDAKGDNTEDFGEHIQVEFLYNLNNFDEVIFETTLAELKDMSPEVIYENAFYPIIGDKGLPVGEMHDLIVKVNFVDNDEDQNEFQGDSLELTWEFVAEQTEGEAK